MQDLAHRVPDDGKHFTVDAHMGPDGRIDIGGRSYSPDEFADVLRRSGWDGQSPVRLVSCNSSDFAGDLAKKLGVDVTAPRGLAWTDTNGNVFAGSRASDGGPTWPPDGGWDTHHPDGTNSPASDDAFHPSRDGEDIGDRPDDAEARGNREKLSEEEIDKRKAALDKPPHDNKYYLYGGGHEARLRDGQSGPPLRWDENSNDWVQREGTLEPTPDTPDHLRDDHTYMRWVYEGDRPAISDATKQSVYQNTEMNPDGSYKCAASGKPIPVAEDGAGKPQFYERTGTPPQLKETTPPDWYTRGEEPPSPPHDKFTVPKQEEVDGKVRSVADMGHQPEYEYWRQREFAIHHDVTRDQYKSMYDHPDHYRLELKSENQKHSHESTAPGFGKYPQLFERHFGDQQLRPISATPVDPQTIVKGGQKLGDPRR